MDAPQQTLELGDAVQARSMQRMGMRTSDNSGASDAEKAGSGRSGRSLRFAYADPPYIGQAKKHYSHDPNCAEVDHAQLIARLNTYDGWALSLSSPTLKQILALCPDDVRVGAWVKPFCAFKVNVNPAYAWEPVIFRGGRKLGRDVDTVRDWCSEVITLKRGLSGVKPERVCHWLFEFLGMERGDVFDDIFPGSGAVTRAWTSYCASPRLSLGGGGAEPVGDDDGESQSRASSHTDPSSATGRETK